MLDDGICNILDCKSYHVNQEPHLVYCTKHTGAAHQVRLLMNMIGYAVHLIVNAVHPSWAPDVLYIIFSTVHLMANAVHPSVAPDIR